MCVMPLILMNSLKSLAINWGPLSEIVLGLASGPFSLAVVTSSGPLLLCRTQKRSAGQTELGV